MRLILSGEADDVNFHLHDGTKRLRVKFCFVFKKYNVYLEVFEILFIKGIIKNEKVQKNKYLAVSNSIILFNLLSSFIEIG